MRNIWIFLFLLFAITGCGGGSGSSDEPEQETSMSAPDAVLGIMLTDAPSDEIEQLLATITRIELVGDAQSHTVFEGEERIDFAQLTDFYELFNITSVTPGSYHTVRIRISDVTIVAEDDSGALVETPVSLPSGTIDVTTENPFTIAGDQVLFLKIDFDIDKALALMEEEGDELMLQPVFFVEIAGQLPADRFVRLNGIVDEVFAEGLRICDTRLIAKVDSKRDGPGACAEIKTDIRTGFFDADGLPADIAGLLQGDEVMVVGYINRRLTEIPAIPYGHLPPPGSCRLWYTDRSNGDQPPPQSCDSFDGQPLPESAILLNDQGMPAQDIFDADALVIEQGGPDTFPRLRGVTTSQVLGDQFGFRAEGEEWGTTALNAVLFPETRIFSRDGAELGPDAIQPELKAKLDGVQAEPGLLRTAFMVLRLDEAPQLRLSGTLLSVNTNTLTLATDSGDRCVDAENADIYLVSRIDGNQVSEEVSPDELTVDQPIEAFGTDGVDGCFIAETLIADGN